MKLRRKRKLIQRQVGLHSIIGVDFVLESLPRKTYKLTMQCLSELAYLGTSSWTVSSVKKRIYKFFVSRVTRKKRNKRK